MSIDKHLPLRSWRKGENLVELHAVECTCGAGRGNEVMHALWCDQFKAHVQLTRMQIAERERLNMNPDTFKMNVEAAKVQLDLEAEKMLNLDHGETLDKPKKFRHPMLTLVYDERGAVYTLVIEWKGEKIQVLTNGSNDTIRELQRADEIIQSLLIHERL